MAKSQTGFRPVTGRPLGVGNKMIPAPVTVQFQEHPAGLAKQVYNSALGPVIRKPVVGHNSHTTARVRYRRPRSGPRWFMTPGLVWLLIAWGVLTGILIIHH